MKIKKLNTDVKPARAKLGMFAIPYLVISAIFVIVPLIMLLCRMFIDANGNFSLSGFEALASPTNYKVLFYSLGIALLNTLICLVLAFPLAYILAHSHFKKHTVLLLLFVAPMWINFLLRVYALKTLLDLISVRSGFFAMMTGMVYDFFPFMLMPLYTVLVNMDKSYKEASSDLGASPFRSFVTVTLPLSVPGIISGTLMVFMPTLSAFAISQMLGGTIFIFGDLINNYFNSMITWNAGAVLAFVMLILVIATTLIGNFVSKNTGKKSKSVSLGVSAQ